MMNVKRKMKDMQKIKTRDISEKTRKNDEDEAWKR